MPAPSDGKVKISQVRKTSLTFLWKIRSMKIWMLCTFIIFHIFLNQGNTQTTPSEVPRIDAAMAFYKYKAGNTILIDAMSSKTFIKKHILGSINLPNDGPQDIERIRNMKLPFPKDKEIIVYCM